MTVYPVSLKKRAALEAALQRLGIRPSDLSESFILSRGAGGQNVQKVSTCVVLRHLPTGIEVRCQRERSQALNRFLARRLLIKKLEERRLGRESQTQKAFEKIRRQKRRRSRRAKEKMLAQKRLRSEKKSLRHPIHPED